MRAQIASLTSILVFRYPKLKRATPPSAPRAGSIIGQSQSPAPMAMWFSLIKSFISFGENPLTVTDTEGTLVVCSKVTVNFDVRHRAYRLKKSLCQSVRKHAYAVIFLFPVIKSTAALSRPSFSSEGVRSISVISLSGKIPSLKQIPPVLTGSHQLLVTPKSRKRRSADLQDLRGSLPRSDRRQL